MSKAVPREATYEMLRTGLNHLDEAVPGVQSQTLREVWMVMWDASPSPNPATTVAPVASDAEHKALMDDLSIVGDDRGKEAREFDGKTAYRARAALGLLRATVSQPSSRGGPRDPVAEWFDKAKAAEMRAETAESAIAEKDAEIARLKSECNGLLELTLLLDEHPDDYDGPCMCKTCMSYCND